MSERIECPVDLLLVEDDPDDARLVERLVLDSPGEGPGRPLSVSEVRSVDNLAAGLEAVRADQPDVVLLDLLLPDSRGLETVDRTVRHAPRTPVVVLTGRSDASVGAEAIRRGAQDYLVKEQLSTETLQRTLRYAIERERNHRRLLDRTHRLALLTRIVTQDVRDDLGMIVGRGDQLRDAVAREDEQVLEGLLEAAEHVVDLIDTAGELVDVLSGDGIRRQPCDLGVALEEAIARVERDHDAEVALADEDATGAVTVHGSTLLAGVFEHLFEHALEHADDGSARLTVDVTVSTDHVRVRIPDAAGALPGAHTDSLATPTRGLGTRSGLGVGLYLVTTVLDEVGGSLEVADGARQSTAVTVELERVGER